MDKTEQEREVINGTHDDPNVVGAGPKKKRSKQRKNAKRGINVDVFDYLGETKSEWNRHLKKMNNAYNPTAYDEKILVQRIAQLTWRLQRCCKAEAAYASLAFRPATCIDELPTETGVTDERLAKVKYLRTAIHGNRKTVRCNAKLIQQISGLQPYNDNDILSSLTFNRAWHDMIWDSGRIGSKTKLILLRIVYEKVGHKYQIDRAEERIERVLNKLGHEGRECEALRMSRGWTARLFRLAITHLANILCRNISEQELLEIAMTSIRNTTTRLRRTVRKQIAQIRKLQAEAIIHRVEPTLETALKGQKLMDGVLRNERAINSELQRTIRMLVNVKSLRSRGL